MSEKQGSLALLNEPLTRQLLNSETLAKLAYVATDGTPRIMPILFRWENGEVIFAASPSP